MNEIAEQFVVFLAGEVPADPMKSEFYLPKLVGLLVQNGKAKVKVLSSSDKWFGVTYKEDKESVVAAIAGKIKSGVYPAQLWED